MRLFDAGKQAGEEIVRDGIWTVPNVLSLLRLVALPFVYVHLTTGRLASGLAIGFVFGATDYVDGYVARRFDQVTRFGKLLDPVSDRFFIVTVLVALVVAGLVPLWAVLVVLARDVLILLGGLVLLGRGVEPPPVTRVGKAATFGLMWTFPAFILSGIVGTVEEPDALLQSLAWVMYAAAVSLYWLAGWQYAVTVRRQLRHPDPERVLADDEGPVADDHAATGPTSADYPRRSSDTPE